MTFLKEYTMLKELGRGGFATVYKVRHDELGYIRAIRVLNETITDERSETYKKFLEECKVLLRLGNGAHPNIVHIYQPRLLNNKALVEMDFVDGNDLNRYLAERNHFIPITDVLRFVNEISNALAYCHEDIFRFCMDMDVDDLQSDPNNGAKILLDDSIRKRLIQKYKVIHNDIHSGNIIRNHNGNFVLLDFGLAIEGDNVVRSSRRRNGAPEFKSPEKWNNESILTEQSDIYSLGIVMYEMLAGRVPFPFDKKLSNQTEAEYNLSKQHQNILPPAIEPLRKAAFEAANPGKHYRKDYPEWLERVILKCLEKKPENRFVNGKSLYKYVKIQIQKTSRPDSEAIDQLVTDLQMRLKNLEDTNHSLSEKITEEKQRNSDLKTEIGKFRKRARLKWAWKTFTTFFVLTTAASLLLAGGIWYDYIEKPTAYHTVDNSQYETVISQQKTEIEELQKEITKLQGNVNSANTKIRNLEQNAQTKSDNGAALAEKDKKINQLEQTVATQKRTISSQKQTITEKDKIIKILQ